MERLSIEEIKEILNRDWNEMKAGYFCINDFRAIEQSMELLDELKAYRDAEEQGLLLRLPCPIGTTVFNTTWWDDVEEKVKVNGKTFFRIAHKHKVSKSKFSYMDIEQFGKTAFLTREEAEKALAEMQEG